MQSKDYTLTTPYLWYNLHAAFKNLDWTRNNLYLGKIFQIRRLRNCVFVRGERCVFTRWENVLICSRTVICFNLWGESVFLPGKLRCPCICVLYTHRMSASSASVRAMKDWISALRIYSILFLRGGWSESGESRDGESSKSKSRQRPTTRRLLIFAKKERSGIPLQILCISPDGIH